MSDEALDVRGLTSEEINIVTLDSFFSGVELSSVFLKIDVEGFEQSVIRGGMSWFLEAHKPIVVMEMNHFCLGILQRVTIPDFLDSMRAVFPYVYAIDGDNSAIADLHDPDKAYMVMHEHVVNNRFPNLVCGFDESIKDRLDTICLQTPAIRKPQGTIRPSTLPSAIVAGQRLDIPVTVTNTGSEDWSSAGANPVRLSYHWKNGDGSTIVFDGVRTDLAVNTLKPGVSVSQEMNVVTPKETGTYTLVLTIVQEGVCWFEERGFTPAVMHVSIS